MMNWLKESKIEIACRVGATISLLSTGFSYPANSVDQIQALGKEAKLRIYPSCGLDGVSEAMIIYRGSPEQLGGFVIGVRKGETEVFPRYTRGYLTSPAATLFSIRGSILDPQGNEISLEPGDKIKAALYPAQDEVVPADVLRISQLRTDYQPIETVEATLPDCTSSQ